MLLKTNSACQRKGDREAKGRHWLLAQEPQLRWWQLLITGHYHSPAELSRSWPLSPLLRPWVMGSHTQLGADPHPHSGHQLVTPPSIRDCLLVITLFKPFQLSGHGWRRRLWPGEAGARRGYMILHWWNGDKIVTWICNGDILSRSPAHSCTQTGYPTSYVMSLGRTLIMMSHIQGNPPKEDVIQHCIEVTREVIDLGPSPALFCKLVSRSHFLPPK